MPETARYADRYTASALILMSIPFFLGVIFFEWPVEYILPVALFVSLLLVLFAVAYWYVREGGIFQPLAIILISTGIGFFGKLVYVAVGYGSNPMVDDFLLLGEGIESLLPGIEIISVSMVCLLLFYVLPSRAAFNRPASIVHHFSGRRAVVIGLVIFCLSLSFFLVYIILFSGSEVISGKRFSSEDALPSERFADVGYYLFKAAFLVKVSFYTFLLASLSSIKRESKVITITLALISFLLSMIISFYFSNRGSLVILFLDALIIVYFVRGKISWRLVLPAVVVVLSAFFFISEFRSEAGAGKTLMDHIFGGRYFFELTKNAHLYNFFSSGGTLMPEAGPSRDAGLLAAYLNLGRAAGGQVFFKETSGVPLGFPAELYAFGGYPLLLFGMALTGIGLRRLLQTVARPVVRDYMIVIYAMITTRSCVFLFNNGLGVALYQITLDLLPFLCTIFLIRMTGNSEPRRSILIGWKDEVAISAGPGNSAVISG